MLAECSDLLLHIYTHTQPFYGCMDFVWDIYTQFHMFLLLVVYTFLT